MASATLEFACRPLRVGPGVRLTRPRKRAHRVASRFGSLSGVRAVTTALDPVTRGCRAARGDCRRSLTVARCPEGERPPSSGRDGLALPGPFPERRGEHGDPLLRARLSRGRCDLRAPAGPGPRSCLPDAVASPQGGSPSGDDCPRDPGDRRGTSTSAAAARPIPAATDGVQVMARGPGRRWTWRSGPRGLARSFGPRRRAAALAPVLLESVIGGHNIDAPSD